MDKQTPGGTSKPIKKKGRRSDISRLTPINLKDQEALFFQSGCTSNPSFHYAVNLPEPSPPLTGDLLPTALSILSSCLRDFGSESRFLTSDGGDLLTEAETKDYIDQYMRDFGLPVVYEVVFSDTAVAPTSVVVREGDNVTIITCAVPLVYRRYRILGVLHHELGTHLLRTLNEKRQVWHKKRGLYKLQAYARTEEGLACINTQYEAAVSGRKCYLWSAALHYYAMCRAQHLSFVELYQDLEQYVDDPYRRWKECVRMKRGFTDTSKKGACTRDSVYLEGAVEILRQRRTLDFEKLYSGKLAIADLARPEIERRCKEGTLPGFLKNKERYLSALDKVAEINGIE